MNIFEKANIRRTRGIYQVRQERIKREGSKYFTWTVPVTAAAAESVIYIPDEFPESRKYEPLDFLEITNNEAANDLTLNINQVDTFLIPAMTIQTFKGRPLWRLGITNDGAGNTTLGKIIVQLRREPQTIDKWARRQ